MRITFPPLPRLARSAAAQLLIAAAICAVPLSVRAAEVPVAAKPDAPAAASPAVMTPNPLLSESTLPFHYPRFDLVKSGDFAPAFEQGMAESLQENEAIAQNPEKPTFDNTIVAMEKAGETLNRVSRFFYNLSSCNTNPELQAVQRVMSKKLAAHSDAILLNPVLFARVQAVYDQRDSLGLDAESKRLLWRYYKDFVRAGAKLPEADKTRLKALNGEIASLQTNFTQNVLKETNASAVVVDTREELAGLSEAQITAAAAAAKADGKEGKFELRLVNTSGQPPLASLTSRAVREKLMEASLARGSRGGEFDNRQVVASIARLRAERAALLGYPNHAAYVVDEQTAGTVDAVNKLLAQLAPPAVANARREAADMQAIVDEEKGGFQIASWDWDFYSEKVRAARYSFDESQLKPYFELNHVLLDGVFFAAGRLYGLTFKERHDLPVYEPTVRVFDVFDADGSQLAIFIADYYARPAKNGGAWMNAYVQQSGLRGDKAVVANHLNIPQPPAGEPTLLTYDEVKTMFHEFGHALHGMFSHVRYPRFAGTQVPRDFVEYPSQVNEMWAVWPEVVKNYAKHYKTGEPLPQPLLDKMLATLKFNQGYTTTEYLAATLLDQAWHQIPADAVPGADGVLAFEAAALKKYGVDFAPVPPRYRTTYFSHTFSGGYSAGYYSYIWAEVLDADSVEWIKQHGGLTRANGDHFRSTLLSRGGSDDAMTLFRNFTGGEPYLDPLLKRRGLDAVVPAVK
jgi:peptidyl-dipeptidase Dcp